MIAYAESSPALPAGDTFSNVQSLAYWKSTNYDADPNSAWFVDLATGNAADDGKSATSYVWAVRDAP